MHEGESSIPLGIMSFKTASSSSSPSCVSSFVSASSSDHADHVNDKDSEEKEVTVHLMKEEAGHYSCLFLVIGVFFQVPYPWLFKKTSLIFDWDD